MGDQTTSGAVFAMITPYITGGRPLLSCGLADVAANWTWPTNNLANVWGVACAVVKDGNVARVFLVNDCNGTPARSAAGTAPGATPAISCADRLINIPVASLGPAPSSVVSITEVSAPALTCLNQTNSKDKLAGGTRPCNDPAFRGLFVPFTSSSSSSGYFGEVSNVVSVSSIPATGLPYLLPVFGFARIDIPLAAQTMTAVTTVNTGIDTTLFAGVSATTSFGSYNLLTVGTSSTSVHDSTGVTLLQFATPTFTAANLALLELTLANAPGNPLSPNGTVILQVIGINPAQPVVWNENAMTWANSQWLLNTPTGLVNSVGTNYVLLGPQNQTNPLAGIYNFVIGHISVSTSDPAGMVKKVDISRFVKRAQAANACSINIAIVRRFRKNTQSPASAAGDTIPADSFTGGAVSFYSGEAAANSPTLRTFSDASAPVATCNSQKQQNFTVSSVVSITNVNAATFNGTLSNLGRRLRQAIPSAASSTSTSISAALGLPSNGVTVSPSGTYVTNVALTLSANSPPNPAVLQNAVAAAAAAYPSAQGTSAGIASSQVIQNLKWNGSASVAFPNGTFYAVPNNVSTTSSDGVASEKHGALLASDAYPVPARRLLFSQDVPTRTGRKLLQQSYQVQVTFGTIADAEAFKVSFAAGTSTVSTIVQFINTNNTGANASPDLNVASISTSNAPSVDAQAVVDVYAPYHSPSSADVVYNVLAQGSTPLNQQFDQTYHGDASDLQIDPTTVQINAGWAPSGANAPASPPELVIVVVQTPPGPPSPSKLYTRNNFIGLGVGLGVGEFVFFSVIAAFAYFSYVKPLEAKAAASAPAVAAPADFAKAAV